MPTLQTSYGRFPIIHCFYYCNKQDKGLKTCLINKRDATYPVWCLIYLENQ